MTFFTMPQGEILNDGSACDVVNIRAGWEKIFPHQEIYGRDLSLAEIYM